MSNAAKTIPTVLSAIPPIALCKATRRNRRPTCINVSTSDSEESMMTTRATSEVPSLFRPNAIPTVAVSNAGASLCRRR